MFAAVFPGVVV